jgi:arylsulfatase A-like enzyme
MPRFFAESDEVFIPSPLPEDSQDVIEDITDFVSSVKEVDFYIGKIKTLIDDSPIKRNTLILFTVDHGIAIPRHKCTLYDSGISVPLILHMPSEIHGSRRIDDLISNIDILPTLLDLVGIKIPIDVQGSSFAGLLVQDKMFSYMPRNYIYAELTFHDIGYNAIRCIRTNKWKFIKNFYPLKMMFEIPDDVMNSKSATAYLKTHLDYRNQRPKEELYDLETDSLELVNLAEEPDYADIKSELTKKLMEYLEQTNDPALEGVIKEPTPPEKGPQRYLYDIELKK